VIKGDKFDEDKYVFKYMEKYGIENVRGGCFSQVVLPEDKIKMIETILLVWTTVVSDVDNLDSA
jgi:hypothetical protein